MFSLSNALNAISARYTPDMRAEDEARNTNLRSKLDPYSRENRIARAKQHEKVVVDQIQMLEGQPDSELKTARLNALLDRLGELYAEQGRYADAIEVTADEERRDYYQSLITAIETPEPCDCQNERTVGREKDARGQIVQSDLTLPVRTEIGTIVTETGTATLTRCAKCGRVVANA